MQPSHDQLADQCQHAIKVRVRTLNHLAQAAHCPQQNCHKGCGEWRAHAHKTAHPKDGLICSLIAKLKSVQRAQEFIVSPRQSFLREQGPRPSNGNQLNGQQPLNSQHSSVGPSHHCSSTARTPITNPRIPQSFPKNTQEHLKQDNLILKEKISEIIVENQKLKWRLKELVGEMERQGLSIKKQQVGIIEEVGKKVDDLLVRQQSQALAELAAKSKLGGVQASNRLSFSKQLEVVVLGQQKQQSSRPNEQINKLRLEKVELEKKFSATLSQYRKKKEDEIEKMRRTFTKNLSHYRELLLKLSAKPPLQHYKCYQEDTLETAILETSSADQS